MAKNVYGNSYTLVIANAGTTSTAVTLSTGADSQKIPLAIVAPSAVNTTTIKFQVSHDGATYNDLYFEGSLFTIAIAASQYIALDRKRFDGVKTFRIVGTAWTSGSSETAQRTFNVVVGE